MLIAISGTVIAPISSRWGVNAREGFERHALLDQVFEDRLDLSLRPDQTYKRAGEPTTAASAWTVALVARVTMTMYVCRSIGNRAAPIRYPDDDPFRGGESFSRSIVGRSFDTPHQNPNAAGDRSQRCPT
jgi:hypothetical protein